MRILHVITTIERGGAENQLLVLVREQIKHDNEVSIFYLKGKNDLEVDFQLLGVHVRTVKPSKFLVKQILALRRLTRDPKIVVHAHLPRAELLTAIAHPKGKFIVSRHNTEPFFPGAPKRISDRLSLFVSGRASNIIAISKTVSDYLKTSGEIPSQIHTKIVHYGYPNKKVIKRDSLQSRRIGTLSRLAPQKDLPTLIRAFQLVLRKCPDLILEIYGEGPERENLEKLVKDLGIEKSVKLMGKTSLVDQAIQGLEIFILTSRYEGFGLVLLEAMANRVPIISSNSAAALEVLGSDFPLFFEIGNYKALAQLILNLLTENKDKYVQYQSDRLNVFSPEKMEAAIAQIYSS